MPVLAICTAPTGAQIRSVETEDFAKRKPKLRLPIQLRRLTCRSRFNKTRAYGNDTYRPGRG